MIGNIAVDIVEGLHSDIFQFREWGEAEEMSFFVFIDCSGITQEADGFENFRCGHEDQVTRIKNDLIAIG